MSTIRYSYNFFDMNIEVSASILSSNFANLEREITRLQNIGVNYIHVDVMDGNFVPNITMGPPIISSIRKYSKIPFDVHLMIYSPHLHIESFAEAGADIITVHLESEIHIDSTIKKIKSYGKKAGLSIVPTTHPSTLEYIIHELDIVLVMSVNPGFSGQKFIDSQLKKISFIRNMIAKYSLNTKIAVDGGLTIENSKYAVEAGAEILVAGSAIFNSENMELSVKKLKQLV